MWLSHGANILISQWGSTIKSPLECTVISRCSSWHHLRCCLDIKHQQSTNQPFWLLYITYSIIKGQLLSYHTYMLWEVTEDTSLYKCRLGISPHLIHHITAMITEILLLWCKTITNKPTSLPSHTDFTYTPLFKMVPPVALPKTRSPPPPHTHTPGPVDNYV